MAKSIEERVELLEAEALATRGIFAALVMDIYRGDTAAMRRAKDHVVAAIEMVYASRQVGVSGHQTLQRTIQIVEELFDPVGPNGGVSPQPDLP